MTAPRLILASGSPRRQELLRDAGFDFIVHPANVDEEDAPAKILPGPLAELLSSRKADAVSQQFPNDVVIGADTVVAFGDEIIGKPADAEDARRILALLSGTTHLVITGITVRYAARNFVRRRRVISCVQMRALSDEEIDRYVAGKGWEGKAGGYGIQDPDPFVTRTAGCHTNIVGLPMDVTRAMLAEAGIHAPRAEDAP